MHVTAIRFEIEDGVPDELAGAVVGDVAAAARLVHGDAGVHERAGGRYDIGLLAACLHAQRDDGRMLEQKERVADATGAAVFDELLLQMEAGVVVDPAETACLEAPLIHHS